MSDSKTKTNVTVAYVKEEFRFKRPVLNLINKINDEKSLSKLLVWERLYGPKENTPWDYEEPVRIAILQKLLEKGADVNYIDRYNGMTPLMNAIWEHDLKAIDLLCNHKVDYSVTTYMWSYVSIIVDVLAMNPRLDSKLKNRLVKLLKHILGLPIGKELLRKENGFGESPVDIINNHEYIKKLLFRKTNASPKTLTLDEELIEQENELERVYKRLKFMDGKFNLRKVIAKNKKAYKEIEMNIIRLRAEIDEAYEKERNKTKTTQQGGAKKKTHTKKK